VGGFGPPFNFFYYDFFNLGCEHFGEKIYIYQNGRIAKILEVWGCIAKIETLKVELKIGPNFGEVKV
jgi:hypothetical protein